MEHFEKRISFEAIAILENGVAYASSKEFNGLYEVDIYTGKCKYVALFPNERFNRKRLHCKAEIYHNKVFFIPGSAEYLSIFDLNKQEFYQIAVPDLKINNNFFNPFYKFTDSYVMDDCLWMIPSSYPAVIKINMRTKELAIMNNWIPKDGFFLRNGSYLLNSKIYIPDTKSNNVIEINTKQDTVKVYPVGKNNMGCWSCNSDDEINIWFAPRNPGPIIKWNLYSNEIEEYCNYPIGYQHNDFLFSKVYMVEQDVCFIPAYGNMMIKISRDDYCLMSIYDDVFKNALNTEYLFETNDFLYLNVVYTDKVVGYQISKIDNALTKKNFFIHEGVEERERDYIFMETGKGSIINESKILGLDSYLSCLLY